jgi:hypothetical protein
MKSALSRAGSGPDHWECETRLRGVLEHDHNGQNPLLVIEEKHDEIDDYS